MNKKIPLDISKLIPYFITGILFIASVSLLFFIQKDNEKREEVSKEMTNQVKGDEANIEQFDFIVEENGGSAYDFLNKLKDNGDIKIEYKEYDFGGQKSYMITSLNDITPDQATHFWKFQINGQDSMVGVSEYIVKEGDRLTFLVDKIEF